MHIKGVEWVGKNKTVENALENASEIKPSLVDKARWPSVPELQQCPDM